MNSRKNVIETMQAFHVSFKNGQVNMNPVENSIKKLPESDRNFMLVTGGMSNIRDVYPVQSKFSGTYSLADLVMAYHWYLEECRTDSSDTAIIDAVDSFYN